MYTAMHSVKLDKGSGNDFNTGCWHGMSMFIHRTFVTAPGLGVQTWEALPPKSQGGFTVGAIVTASSNNFLPTSATIAGKTCAIVGPAHARTNVESLMV